MKMEYFVKEAGRILKYSFKNKKLLEEALTHSSANPSKSYQRLKFFGDAALGLAFTTHIFLEYPHLNSGQLSLLRSANLRNEKLAQAAARSGLYRCINHDSVAIQHKVADFVAAVEMEGEIGVVHRRGTKAPKVLADIVESVAAAVYVDSEMDLNLMWKVMEPALMLKNAENAAASTMIIKFKQP